MIFRDVFRLKISKIYEIIDLSWNILATLSRLQPQQQNNITYHYILFEF